MKIWSVNTFSTEKGDKVVREFFNDNLIYIWQKENKKRTLKNINQCDWILAYHNKKQIVGVGIATAKSAIDEDTKEWINVNWLCQNLDNPIHLADIESDKKVSMFREAVFNWTENISMKKLLTEIGKRQA